MQTIVKVINPWTIISVLLFPAAANVFATWLPASVSRLVGLVTLTVLASVGVSYLILLFYNKIVPLRFANLVYVLDEDRNLAVIYHPFHKKWMPPGSRLGYHEAPHQAVPRVLKEELDLEANYFKFWPNFEAAQYGPTEIVQPPYQVQVEKRKQRVGVRAHYDFVYVGTVNGVKPPLESQLNPQWRSLEDLKELRRIGAEGEPFADIIPTFEKIRNAMSGP
jgi:ADP-ribose pyrophosphatase YjhB (NUDIX family)